MLQQQRQAQVARETQQPVRQSPVQPSRTGWSSQAPSGLSDGHRPAVPTQVGHPLPKQRPARIQLQQTPVLTAAILRPVRSVLNCPEQLQDRGSAQTSMAAQKAGEPRRFD